MTPERRRIFTPIRKLALLCALLLAMTVGVLSLLGMRSDVAFLSSGPTSEGDAVSGIAYVLSWFGAVLLTPTLVLFVLLDLAAERLWDLMRWIASSRR